MVQYYSFKLLEIIYFFVTITITSISQHHCALKKLPTHPDNYLYTSKH